MRETVVGATGMSPDELMEKVREHGIAIARPTLNRWVQRGLVGSPQRKALGRGRGSYTDYPPDAVAQAVAAGAVLRTYQATFEEVCGVRTLALQGHNLAAFVGIEAPEVLKRSDLYRWLEFALSPPVGLEWLRDELYKPEGKDWTPREATRFWWLLTGWVAAYNSAVPGSHPGGADQVVFERRSDGLYWLTIDKAGR